MEDLAKFKNQIYVHCGIIAVVSEIVPLFIIGFDVKFLTGIIAGTFITMINFNILMWSARKMLQNQSKGPVVGGYFIRMPIYGVSFFFCLKWSGYCAIGCVIGFITLAISILIIYGIESRLPGAKKNPLNSWTQPKEWRDPSEWEDEEDDYKDF